MTTRGLLDRVAPRLEAAGEAAGYDRLRAEREVIELDAEVAASRADRARAQGELQGFFGTADAPTSLVAVVPEPAPRPALPGAEAMVSYAESVLPELAALKQEITSADFAARAAARSPTRSPARSASASSASTAAGTWS